MARGPLEALGLTLYEWDFVIKNISFAKPPRCENLVLVQDSNLYLISLGILITGTSLLDNKWIL